MRTAFRSVVLALALATIGYSPTVAATSPPPGFVLQETLTVPADGSSVPSGILQSGVGYKVRASGTIDGAVSGPCIEADAEYGNLGPSSPGAPCTPIGSAAGFDIGLAINTPPSAPGKLPAWGPFDPGHVYTVDFVGLGAPIALHFHDCGGCSGDNSGSFSVEIFAPAPPTALVFSVLPSSRSVRVGTAATAFMTVINAGSAPALGVTISPGVVLPGQFTFQSTDPHTNLPTGTPNDPIDIGVGQSQSFVIAFHPNDPIAPVDLPFGLGAGNYPPVAVNVGVNTLLLTASAAPVPDVVALSATLASDGIVRVPTAAPPSAGSASARAAFGTGVFAVATVNLGITGSITASADTGTATLPVSIALCQTVPATGACLGAPAGTVTADIGAGTTPTFGVFVTALQAIPFDPAASRIFVRFKDAGGVTRGSTSVAVRTD